MSLYRILIIIKSFIVLNYSISCYLNPPKKVDFICNITKHNNCDGKFDVIPEVHWSPKNLKTIDGTFYFPTKNATKLDLNVKNYNKFWDVCFQIKYFVTENASLNLLLDNKKVDVNLASIEKNHWSSDQKLCVDDLKYNLNKEFTLSFENVFKDDSASAAIQLNIPGLFYQKTKLDSIPFISRWGKRDNEVKPIDDLTLNNMWPFMYPQNSDKKGQIQVILENDSITFKG